MGKVWVLIIACQAPLKLTRYGKLREPWSRVLPL